MLKTEVNTKEIDTCQTRFSKSKTRIFDRYVKYKATDYVSINQKEQKIYLYNEAEVYYEDMEITLELLLLIIKKMKFMQDELKIP